MTFIMRHQLLVLIVGIAIAGANVHESASTEAGETAPVDSAVQTSPEAPIQDATLTEAIPSELDAQAEREPERIAESETAHESQAEAETEPAVAEAKKVHQRVSETAEVPYTIPLDVEAVKTYYAESMAEMREFSEELGALKVDIVEGKQNLANMENDLTEGKLDDFQSSLGELRAKLNNISAKITNVGNKDPETVFADEEGHSLLALFPSLPSFQAAGAFAAFLLGAGLFLRYGMYNDAVGAISATKAAAKDMWQWLTLSRRAYLNLKKRNKARKAVQGGAQKKALSARLMCEDED